MDMTPKKYIEIFYYDLFNQYENKGFLGNMNLMRYILSIKTQKYISKSYLIYTLKIFREIKLIEKNSILNFKDSVNINILDTTIYGNSLYLKTELDNKTINDKIAKIEELFSNINSKIHDLIKDKELKQFQDIQKNKKDLYFKIFKDNTYLNNFFNDLYEQEYGKWMLDIDPLKFKQYMKKINKYDEFYFNSKRNELFLKDKTNKNIEESINHWGVKTYYKLYDILKSEVDSNGFITAKMDNVYINFKLTAKFTDVIIDKKGEIILISKNTIAKLGFSSVDYKNGVLKCKDINFMVNDIKLRNEIDSLITYNSKYREYLYGYQI